MTSRAETVPIAERSLEGNTRRYFNWVEIDKTPESDLRTMLPLFLGVLALVGAGLAALLWVLMKS